MNALHEPVHLALETTEGVIFRIPLASPFSRGIAWAVDMLVILVLCRMLEAVILLMQLISVDFGQGLGAVLFFGIQILYAIVLETCCGGRTIGKMLLKLRVVDARGLNLTARQIWIRNLLRFVDMFPVGYLLGGLISFFSPHYQRLGDWAAGTVVSRQRKGMDLPALKIDSTRHNSLEKYPQWIARLRQELSADEVELAFQALLRRDHIQADKRIQVFDTIVENWKSKAPLPHAELEQISSENLVRNALELLIKGSQK